MGEYIQNTDGSIDFVAEQRRNDKARDRGQDMGDFSSLMNDLSRNSHHGGGSSDTPAPKVEASDPAINEPETPDSTEATDMMARFTAGGVGEVTSEEQSAIKESRAEIETKKIENEVEAVHSQEASQPTGKTPDETVAGQLLEGAVPKTEPRAKAGVGPLRSELHNLEQQIVSAKSSLSQATTDGGERYAHDRIRALESKRVEVLSAIQEAQSTKESVTRDKGPILVESGPDSPVPTKEPETKEATKEVPEDAVDRAVIMSNEVEGAEKGERAEIPNRDVRASEKAIRSQLYHARKQGSEKDVALLLGLAVQKRYLDIDDNGKAIPKTPDSEQLLKAAGRYKSVGVVIPKPEATLESTNDLAGKTSNEGAVEDESTETAKEQAPAEKEVTAEAAKETEPVAHEAEVTEAVPAEPEAEPTAEVAPNNPVYLALEKEITESLNLNKPAERSAFALALLWVFKREVFDSHHIQMVSYHERKDKLESLQKIKSVWDAKLGDLRGETLVMGGEVAEIISGIVDGTASKRDQEKIAKKIAQLSNKKEIFEGQQMARTASLLGIEIPEVTQDSWKGVDSSSKEFGVVVTKERDDLVADLRQGGTGTRLNAGKARTLQDLSAETQELFLTTEGDNSLTRLATARATSANIKEQVDRFLQGDKLADNPLFLYQLYNGLRTAEVNERQAEAQVSLALDCASKGESLKELKDQVIQRVKKQVGEKAFGVDSGFEVRADTKLSELVLNGSNDLATTISFYWDGFNAIKEMAQKTAFGVNNLKRFTTGWLENQVPEITEIGQKHSESLARLAEIRVDLDRVQGNRKMIAEIQKEASDRRQTALENSLEETKRMNAEQRAKTVDSMIAGMIGMLEIPAQSKQRLQRMYQSERLDDAFLNELLGYYQKSKFKLEQKRKLAEEKLADVLDRKAYLEDVLRKSSAGEMFVSLDEVEDELAFLNQQVDEKILANKDRMDIITRDYRAQIRNLESELDEEMYQSILQKLA